MSLETIQPAFFDALIWLLVVSGIPWAFWRLRQDLKQAVGEERDA